MTKIFIDSSSIQEITKWNHIIEGVTTNPSILRKGEVNLEEICALVSPRPVSVEVGQTIYSEAHKLRDWLGRDGNLVVKIPFLNALTGKDNLEVITKLVEEDFSINCTAVLSISQCFLASKTGCRYVSVFGGRIEDEGISMFQVINTCQEYILNACIPIVSIDEVGDRVVDSGTELIVGSIRSIGHITDCIRAEVDIMTISPQVLEKMTQHKYALETSREFEADYVSIDVLRNIAISEALSDADLEKLVGH